MLSNKKLAESLIQAALVALFFMNMHFKAHQKPNSPKRGCCLLESGGV
jgi:hypothetical protein